MGSSFRKPYTVTRFATGTFTKGKYTEGAGSTFDIMASKQPMKPDEMQLLPEGRRDSESFRLYTDTKLNTADDTTKTNADTVAIDGDNFEVLSCASWQNSVINHFKAIVVKL